jgi:hypothetical protein
MREPEVLCCKGKTFWPAVSRFALKAEKRHKFIGLNLSIQFRYLS